MIKNLSTIILLLFFVGIANSQQNTTIPNADPFCSDTGIIFQNVSDGSSAENGIDYGCLTTQPNPSWFFIRIDLPGDLSLQIEQNTQDDFTGGGLDVDFIAIKSTSNPPPVKSSCVFCSICNDKSPGKSILIKNHEGFGCVVKQP